MYIRRWCRFQVIFYDFQKLSKSRTNVSKWWTPLNNCIPIITDFLKMSFNCDIHISYCTILVKCYKLNCAISSRDRWYPWKVALSYNQHMHCEIYSSLSVYYCTMHKTFAWFILIVYGSLVQPKLNPKVSVKLRRTRRMSSSRNESRNAECGWYPILYGLFWRNVPDEV